MSIPRISVDASLLTRISWQRRMELSVDQSGYIVVLSTVLCLCFGLVLLSFSSKETKKDGQTDAMKDGQTDAVKDGQNDGTKSTKRIKKYANGDIYEGEIRKSDLHKASSIIF